MSNEQNSADFIIDDVDISSVAGWDGNSGPQVGPGDYHVRVVGVELEPSKKDNGRSIKMFLEIQNEGDFCGQQIWHWLKIPTAADKDGVKKRLAHVVRDVLGVPLLPTGGFEAKHLIDREMIVTVTHEEQTSFDAVNNVETKKVRTRVQGERPVEGTATPAPAAAPPTPPANAKPAGAPATAARRPAAAPPGRR